MLLTVIFPFRLQNCLRSKVSCWCDFGSCTRLDKQSSVSITFNNSFVVNQVLSVLVQIKVLHTRRRIYDSNGVVGNYLQLWQFWRFVPNFADKLETCSRLRSIVLADLSNWNLRFIRSHLPCFIPTHLNKSILSTALGNVTGVRSIKSSFFLTQVLPFPMIQCAHFGFCCRASITAVSSICRPATAL